MFMRIFICLIALSVTACSMTEDHSEHVKSTSYHEISLPGLTEDLPSRPIKTAEEELHVNNCQVFFDATLASAAQKLVQLDRM
jgi:hypothetical protein